MYRCHSIASTNPHVGSIKISLACCVLGILWMYRLECVSYIIHGFGMVWYLLGAFTLGLSVLVYLRGEAKFTTVHSIVLLFCVSIVTSSIISGTAAVVWIDELFDILMLAVVMDIGLQCGGLGFLKAGCYISRFFITANTISALVFPNAMFHDVTGAPTIFLLGADNSLIVRYMLAILFEYMYLLQIKGSNKLPIIGLINILLFSIVRDIATGKVVSIILIALFFTAKNVRGFSLAPSFAVLVNVVFFLVVVVGQSAMGWADPIFQMLGRDSDFTHRAYLWGFSLDLILQNPVIGIGCFSADTFNHYIMTMTTSGLFNTGNPHNTYLTIMLSGGIVACALFSATLLLACIEANKAEHNLLGTVLAIFLLAFMLHAQIEGRDTAYILMISVCIFTLSARTGFSKSARLRRCPTNRTMGVRSCLSQ